MADILIVAVLILILGGVSRFIYREKKRGAKCIGCPDSKTCSGHCAGCNGCSGK